MPRVAKDKDTDEKKGDRHKPRRIVGIPGPLADALEQLADEEFNTLAEQVKIACREYLERRGRLPRRSKGAD
jgi:hypothetical protein